MSTLIQPVVTSITGTASEIDASGSTGAVTIGIVDPLAVSKGGTGDTGTAWSAYTPAITPASGTYTSATAAGTYAKIGKTTFIRITVTITTNGTAAGGFNVTLPTGIIGNAAGNAVLSVAEVSATGFAGRAIIQTPFTSIDVKKYDNTYLGGNGYIVVIAGTYETA